jgi:hypothetical protein
VQVQRGSQRLMSLDVNVHHSYPLYYVNVGCHTSDQLSPYAPSSALSLCQVEQRSSGEVSLQIHIMAFRS